MGQLKVKNGSHRTGSQSDSLSSVYPHTSPRFTSPSSRFPLSPRVVSPSQRLERWCVCPWLLSSLPAQIRPVLAPICNILRAAPPPALITTYPSATHHRSILFFLFCLFFLVFCFTRCYFHTFSLLTKQKTTTLKDNQPIRTFLYSSDFFF